MSNTADRYGLTAGEWDNTPVQCKGCGNYYDLDDLTRSRRGFFCAHCVKNGESDCVAEASRPLASGVHISKRLALGALGFTPVHRNDGPAVKSRPSSCPSFDEVVDARMKDLKFIEVAE
jgi:hypothetical protein